MAFQNPPGVNDILPESAWGHHVIQDTARRVFEAYGYRLVETPLFERTEVFTRGIGQATDIVGKEMYCVFPASALNAPGALGVPGTLNASDTPGASETPDLPGASETSAMATAPSAPGDNAVLTGLALRPEGTAGVARAVVQYNLAAPGTPPVKLWYAGSMFRHERHQKGRYREFRQIGAECFGAAEPSADAELIVMLMRFFAALGIPKEAMTLKINSMGDEACRPLYRSAVRDYILARKEEFCPECLRRANTNPLRALDCKNPACRELLKEAPRIGDFLCEDCAGHYAAVKELLSASGLAFEEDARLVRGFDYYTRTVFEVQVDAGLGAQNAIGGGGRYDKLLEEYGAKPTPSLGFAVGVERILLVLVALGLAPELKGTAEVFVAAQGGGVAAGAADATGVAAGAEAALGTVARTAAFVLTEELRAHGLAAALDHQARSLKSQFKTADKLGVRFVVVIGPDELAEERYTLRDMISHTQESLTKTELLETLLAAQ